MVQKRCRQAFLSSNVHGHQIICKALGGEVERAEEGSSFLADVTYTDGTVKKQLFTHQDHVIDSGEMEVVASSEHCEIAVCKHPTRPIKTVQFQSLPTQTNKKKTPKHKTNQ